MRTGSPLANIDHLNDCTFNLTYGILRLEAKSVAMDQYLLQWVAQNIHFALEQNTTSWVLMQAAGLYWRSQGDAYEVCMPVFLLP